MDPLPLHFFVAAADTLRAGGTANPVVRRVCTDSREARAGDLFVALRGEHHDGHAFLRDAAERGVAAAMISADADTSVLPAALPVLRVDDTRAALGRMAAAYRRRFTARVACVAGSNGKTTTKELLAALLGSRYRTLRSEASHNNDVGVPMTLLRMDSRHEAAVLEAGTNHPGELAPLARMIAPEIGLVTSIGREHLEHFGGIDGVVAEEGSLGEELPPAGVLVINGDHGHAGVLAARTRAHVVKAGFAPGNAWRPRVVESRWESTLFLLSAPGPEWNGEFEIGLPGRHMVANAAVALAAAAAMGVAPDDAREALARFRGAKQRLQWSDLGGVRLIDDTYNANADSVLAALQTLSDLPCAGRRVAVLGDMAELGSHAESAHGEVGAAAARLGIDAVVAIGRFATLTTAGARGARQVLCFPDVETALPAVRQLVRPGDSVLAKASRSSRLERVVEALRLHLEPHGPLGPGN